MHVERAFGEPRDSGKNPRILLHILHDTRSVARETVGRTKTSERTGNLNNARDMGPPCRQAPQYNAGHDGTHQCWLRKVHRLPTTVQYIPRRFAAPRSVVNL